MKRLVPEIVLEHYRQRRSIGRFRAVAMSVDISGFTGLAESLMRHRQTGAEVITQVLNQVLSPLIRKVYALGGFVASFAGDSLTALFPLSEGVDASRHCVKIARFARDRSTENGTVHTPSGAFDIGVRIGLSQGQVKLSILGTGTKHAYHFRGSGIESCAQALARAGKGEVLVTGDFRNSLSSWIKTVPVNGFHRIVDCDSEEHIPREIIQALYQGSPPSEEELGHFALDRVLDLVKSGASAELRSVTATFIDFEDKMDDADLNRFVSSVLELAEEYGGYVNKLLFGEKGASILVLFGAPRTLENDCARTADFLLALKQKEPLVPWNAGSAFGMVYAGLIGCEERCEYTSIGDIVNLAARIAQQKNWGEFRMNRELAERLQGTHDLQLVDSFSFKGKLTLQPIYRLTGRRSLADSSFFSGHIVGRKGELATLQDWIAPALNGGFAGIMYICGDPGIGKSRLAEEFHQRITSMPGMLKRIQGMNPGGKCSGSSAPPTRYSGNH